MSIRETVKLPEIILKSNLNPSFPLLSIVFSKYKDSI